MQASFVVKNHFWPRHATAFLALLLPTLAVAAQVPVASEYTVTDLNNLSATELAALPRFRHYVPVPQEDAPANIRAVARSSAGVAGDLEISTTFNQGNGAVLLPEGQMTVPSFGTYYWERLTWDGTDYHFSNGRVNHAHLLDINDRGQVVGYATVESRGDSSSGARTHAFVVQAQAPHGSKIDLTPQANRAVAAAINNRGAIVGAITTTDGPQRGFRRSPDGTLQKFVDYGYTSKASAINEVGLVVGTYHEHYAHALPFASPAGTAMEPLGMPTQGSPDAAQPSAVNLHGMVVGTDWRADASWERQAVRWHQSADGAWVPEDLNELLEGGDVILEQALDVNDAGYLIVSGRPDGTDTPGTHTYLLTPDVLTPMLDAPLVLTCQTLPDGSLQLSWPTTVGFSYTLQFSENGSTWESVETHRGDGNQGTYQLTPGSSPRRFVQVRARLP
jgi:hypothetical protein